MWRVHQSMENLPNRRLLFWFIITAVGTVSTLNGTAFLFIFLTFRSRDACILLAAGSFIAQCCLPGIAAMMLIRARKEVLELLGRKIWAPICCASLTLVAAGLSLTLLKLAQPPIDLFSVISPPLFRNLSNDTRAS